MYWCINGLTILDGEVSGYQHVGVLAGTSKGKVTGTKISGNVSGHSYIGVALGENYSIIEAVVSGDAVSTSSSVGGVVGYNGSNAKIYSVYTSGRDTVIEEWMREFDYIKIGAYKERLGPLYSKSTNQRLYKKNKHRHMKI